MLSLWKFCGGSYLFCFTCWFIDLLFVRSDSILVEWQLVASKQSSLNANCVHLAYFLGRMWTEKPLQNMTFAMFSLWFDRELLADISKVLCRLLCEKKVIDLIQDNLDRTPSMRKFFQCRILWWLASSTSDSLGGGRALFSTSDSPVWVSSTSDSQGWCHQKQIPWGGCHQHQTLS